LCGKQRDKEGHILLIALPVVSDEQGLPLGKKFHTLTLTLQNPYPWLRVRVL